MEIRLGDALAAFAVLNKVIDREIPIKTAYWLGRAATQIESEVRTFEAARMKAVKKYCELDEEGNPISEDDHYKITDTEGFNKEYQELLDEKFEIKFEPISIDAFGDVSITPREVIALGVLIKEE